MVPKLSGSCMFQITTIQHPNLFERDDDDEVVYFVPVKSLGLLNGGGWSPATSISSRIFLVAEMITHTVSGSEDQNDVF